MFVLLLPRGSSSLHLLVSAAEKLGRHVHQPGPGETTGHHLRVRHGKAHAECDAGQLEPQGAGTSPRPPIATAALVHPTALLRRPRVRGTGFTQTQRGVRDNKYSTLLKMSIIPKH